MYALDCETCQDQRNNIKGQGKDLVLIIVTSNGQVKPAEQLFNVFNDFKKRCKNISCVKSGCYIDGQDRRVLPKFNHRKHEEFNFTII